MAISDEYEDIPGTVVFDAQRARQGYHLNMFCMSLMKAENRAAFKANEAEYLQRYPMTDAQREAVLKRDWLRMIQLGGNMYYVGKLGATDGLSFQQLAAKMSAPNLETYQDMMIKGGRSVEGNRSKSEWKNRGQD
jgi:protocatechuate 4,5-dioxygenase, alpha chain